MDRSFARLAAALLLGSALAGCSTFSSDSAKPAAPKDAKAAPSGKTLAADLDAQIHAAQLLRAQGDYPGATKMLSQLMIVAPDDARVVGEYGKNLVQQGRSREALDFLKRAVELQPGDWTLYSATGVAYDQNGDYANARLAYQQALAIKPGNAGVLNNYALSRMQAGDLATARQLMAQATSAGGADTKITHNVALLASLTPAQGVAPVAPAGTVPAQAVQAPAALARNTPARPDVVMQQVPKDPLAGPAKRTTAPKVAATAAHKVAAGTPAPKKAVAKNTTPSLRMTADVATP